MRKRKDGNKTFRGVLAAFLAMFLVVALAAGGSVLPSSAAEATAEATGAKVRVLIGFTGRPGAAEEALVRAFGGTVRHTYELIPSIAAEVPLQALPGLARNPLVALVEPDIRAYAIGNYEEDLQAELERTWGMVRIGEGAAHGAGAFGAAVKVAVVDSGIDYRHPEFTGIYKGGYDFVNSPDDPAFPNDFYGPLDADGHGTHVAGTVAAARNGIGVAGAAPGVELYALKVLEGGSGSFSDIIAALDWCIANGIQVTNNSYGSSGDPGTQVRNAFQNAYAAGVLHIAAAGNAGKVSGTGDNVGYPARYPSVVAVAASTSADTRASYSSTGPDVEIMAPGSTIYSTYLNGYYATMSGTSMASPHVAGVAAQLLGAGPGLTPDGVRDILGQTAWNLGLPATQQGAGLVRADLAVAAVGEPAPDPEPEVRYDIMATAGPGGGISPSGTVSVLEGGSQTFGIAPDAGHAVADVLVDGSSVGAVGIYTFANVAADHTIHATFKEAKAVTAIQATVATDRTSYIYNSWVGITVAVASQDGAPVEGAGVSVRVKDPAGKVVAEFAGATGGDGRAAFSHRVPNKAPVGTYAVEAVATLGSLNDGAGTIFSVTKR
ncbi:S8 family serine peptidase [Anaerotalea alkaliphila]|uniref:S8 family serine peptidase n=1 Tax=Anaerotalea alkaliphila TaxID=2662126 RepID=A0A7X5HV80_9FIRM|nr:S8 family serine peptidase [Anaerotalea alkaliphila]NDL67266.1 S8 family serine peptidase [Anaerotalea alkaliphila]